MKPTFPFIAVALAVILVACGKQTSKEEAPKESGTSSGNPVTAPVDYLGAVAGAKKKMEGNIGLSSMTQAIQQFQIAEGRLPKELSELVTKGYLGQIPKPPYQMRYQYNPATGELAVVPVQ